MKLAGKWLLDAMSDNGVPSASRFISVVALLVMAPGLLVAAALRAPDQMGLSFEVWVTVCGGVYVGGRFAPKIPDLPKGAGTVL